MDCLVYAEKMDKMEYMKTRKTKRVYKKARNSCYGSTGRLLHKQQVHDCNPEELSTSSCCVASYADWRVMLDPGRNYDCFLWNSTSHQKAQLPKIKIKFQIRSSKCIFTAPPTEEHCAVFFFFQDEPEFLYCKVGSSCWTEGYYSRHPEYVRSEAICCNGKIFATVENSKLLFEFDPWSESCRQTSITSEEEEEFEVDPIKQNLVEGGGELFIVQRFSESKLEIYKLDFSCGRWVKVHNLGNLAFVLCGLHSVSLNAEDLGVQGNCVYFTEDDFESLNLFNLGNETLSILQNRPDSGSLWLSLDGQVPILRLSDNATDEQQKEGLKVDGVGGRSKDDEITEDDNSIFPLLPWGVLGNIAKCLGGGVDYMNFRLACRSWSLIAPPYHWRHDVSTTTTTMPYPWLMSFGDQAHNTCKFYDPRDNVTYRMRTPEFPPDCVIRYAREGWILATHGEKSVFLLELFTKEKIQLPDLPFPIGGYGIACMSFSPSPSSLDYWVFGIRRDFSGECHIFMYQPEPNRWGFSRPITDFMPLQSNAFSYRGMFHCLGEDGGFGVYDMDGELGEDGGFGVDIDGDYLKWWLFNKDQKLLFPTPVSRSFLIFTPKMHLPILAVFVGELGSRWVHVYKYEKFDSLTGKWVKLDRLGNLALFVSETRSLVVETDEGTATAAMKNRIYFPIFSSNKIIYYSLETCTFHTSGDDEKLRRGDFVDTKEQLNCTWFHSSSLVPTL